MKKNEGEPFGALKIFFKIKNEVFEQSHSAEKCRMGTLRDFLTSIMLQNVETNEGGILWCNPKSFKKVT